MVTHFYDEREEWKPPKKRRSDHRKTFRGYDGCDYTADEVEFGKAMERLKRQLGRTPTWCEVFAAAKELGYRRPVRE